MKFSLYDREDDPLVERVTQFRYLGRTLKEIDSDLPALHRNVRNAQAVWRRPTKMLLWGQGGSQVSALFYREEIQALLMFGLESWVLSDAMIQEVEGTHVGFIRNITGKRERRQSNRTWETLAADEVLWAAGTQ